MAKSLRSSSKLRARNVKRHNPKSDYAVAEAARLNALNARLNAGLKKEKLPVEGAEEQDDEEQDAEEMKDVTDVNEHKEPVKISTSGPRDSRRETYRKSKGLKPFKNKGGNSLFDAHKSKNGGKPKRRR